jgi:hypothetical protein
MSPNDILVDVRRQPFEPFRMVMLDGTAYDIRHPDQCMVLATAVIVGVSTDPNPLLHFDRYVKLDCRHVTRIEPLGSQAHPGANGPPS